MFQQVISNPQVFEWIAQHLQVIGWPALCVAAWKVSNYIQGVTAQATKTVGQIDKMATNCFPTMEASLKNQDQLLHSVDGSLKTLVENSMKARRHTDR